MRGMRIPGLHRATALSPPSTAMQQRLALLAVVLALAVLGLLLDPSLDGLAAFAGR